MTDASDIKYPDKPWAGAGARERTIYAHYRDGSTRGYLHDHYRRGMVGLHRPDRSHPTALAAWLAGEDAAVAGMGDDQPETRGHVMAASRVNHGILQCSNCHATDLEIAHAIGPVCTNAPSTRREPPSDVPDTRMMTMLEILGAMGGTSDAGDYKGNWLTAFWEEHEGRSPDSYNMAEQLGYTTVSHDTSTDVAMVYLTDAGRQLLAGGHHVDPRREMLIDHLGSTLSESYDCKRVWSAWSHGTMAEDDFTATGDRSEEIADEILTLLGLRLPR